MRQNIFLLSMSFETKNVALVISLKGFQMTNHSYTSLITSFACVTD